MIVGTKIYEKIPFSLSLNFEPNNSCMIIIRDDEE